MYILAYKRFKLFALLIVCKPEFDSAALADHGAVLRDFGRLLLDRLFVYYAARYALDMQIGAANKDIDLLPFGRRAVRKGKIFNAAPVRLISLMLPTRVKLFPRETKALLQGEYRVCVRLQ